MTLPKKQLKITKLFKKRATKITDDDCDELQDEVKELEQKLREKQNELFQIQRNSLRKKQSPPKKREHSFVRPQRIMLNNSIESLKRNLELVSMLTSTEIQSYVAGEHCCVIFHMQHDSEHAVSHGLRVEMESGIGLTGKNEITASSLPLGFNLSAVIGDFENVMEPEFFCAVRKALVAYYDRLEQFQELKKLLNIEAELFKTLDGSYMEISFCVQNELQEEEGRIPLTLTFDYRVYDIRPKVYNIKEMDQLQDAADVIREQCAIFKKKPLQKAFKQAFLSGIGQYQLVPQFGRSPGEARRLRPHHRHDDDTFLPEHCPDQGDEDDSE